MLSTRYTVYVQSFRFNYKTTTYIKLFYSIRVYFARIFHIYNKYDRAGYLKYNFFLLDNFVHKIFFFYRQLAKIINS